MERRDMEIFLTLAAELHFGRTAELLHVSTARISQTIKKWERRVGVPLFDRTSRKVTMTPIGQQLYDDLRPAFEQMEAAVRRAVEAGRGVQGRMRVGFVGAAAGRFVLTAAEMFGSRHPECEVQIRESQFGDGFELLRSGDVDVLLAAFPMQEPDLQAGPVLFSEDRWLAVSARHPFASRAWIRLADVARDRLLRSPPEVPDYWDRSLGPATTADGRPAERGPVFRTIQEMLALVGAGQGVYPVPEQAGRFYQRPDVAYVPIADAPPFEWGLIWRADSLTDRVRAFALAAQDTAGSESAGPR